MGDAMKWPSRKMACTRFRRHRVRCFHGTGGASWRGGSSTREFKLEAVRLIKERGVSYAQASQDLECISRTARVGEEPLRTIRSMPSPARVR